jgi:large subunit ribosomal protein L5
MADKKDKPDKVAQADKAEQTAKSDAAAKAKREGKARQAQQKQAAEDAKTAAAAPLPPEPKLPARLRVRFEQEIAPALMRELKIENRMRVPRLQKITINMALQEARDNVKILDSALEELKVITGQKPVLTRARKAISNFKLRQGMPIGVMVTLRRERMWEFFDRLVNVSLPRVRDFRGVSDKAFDGRGNYSLGLKEHTIFPELNLDKVEKVKGLTISITTTARSDFEGQTLLRALGMPMRGATSGDDSDVAKPASKPPATAPQPAAAQAAPPQPGPATQGAQG